MFTSVWVEMLGGEICYFNAGGIRTRALHAGSGEPLVFLHGMGGHAEAFIKNILPLATRFHVYAIDMIGHGYTDKPNVAYVIPDFVDHVLKFLDAIGGRKAHISGESLGGWVSTWLTMKHPERVASLTLNTSAGLQLTDRTPEAEAQAVERLKKLTKDAAAETTRESVRRRLEWLFLDPKVNVTDELVEIRYQIYRQPETQRAMQTIVGQLGEGTKPYMLTREILSRIKVPTTIIWTRHNPTTPWQVGQIAHEIITGSKFHVMDDCGHWPQWEQPEVFNRLLLECVPNPVTVGS